ncbi:MAG: hypothetical protein IJV01_00500 [Bacteroidales bacterium]|nr:hypothetical protein [Bacteroidales bacterium]
MSERGLFAHHAHLPRIPVSRKDVIAHQAKTQVVGRHKHPRTYRLSHICRGG